MSKQQQAGAEIEITPVTINATAEFLAPLLSDGMSWGAVLDVSESLLRNISASTKQEIR